jgi:uncharacterized protein YndB with AHSA1/START domain
VPRYAAEQVLLAPLDDVWNFLAEPYNLADWWPGISGVEPDRRGFARGARWKVLGSMEPTLFRRPQSSGVLVVLDVQPRQRLAFQLTSDRLDAELTLRAADEARTEVSLVVEGPWLVGHRRRAFPRQALDRLHSLLRTSEDS